MTHRNLAANWAQLIAGYLPDYRMPQSAVSWLPFYHDMGLMLGLCAGVLGGWPSTILSPMAFLQRPARWMQALADHPQVLSAAPNFAFELAADGEILRVDMRAGFNIALSETDYLVVATHSLALSDTPGRNLVAGRHETENAPEGGDNAKAE